LDLKRLENENEEQYLWRIGNAKDKGLIDIGWDEIADIMNREFRADESEYRTEASYRKPYQQAKRFADAGVFCNMTEDSYLRELRFLRQDVQKEKQKLFDERVALNKTLREQSRIDSMYDMVKRAIDDYKPIRFEYFPNNHGDSNNDLIIHLTDLHCGVNIKSPLNEFNAEILSGRLKKYLNEIRDICEIHYPESAYVILGGDMIQGLIHTNARIESKENVVLQIMTVSDLISNFVFELSKMFKGVEVHTTAGNHSRAVASKEEAAHGENFDLLIPYVCKKDLKNVENVVFIDNYLDSDIATFSVRGHMVYATHGDKDTAANVVYHMTQFARRTGLPLPDLCYLGHRHCNGLTTVDGVKVIESGCVDGSDTYAIEKRLLNSPEQTVTVVTKNHRIKALYDIQLD